MNLMFFVKSIANMVQYLQLLQSIDKGDVF